MRRKKPRAVKPTTQTIISDALADSPPAAQLALALMGKSESLFAYATPVEPASLLAIEREISARLLELLNTGQLRTLGLTARADPGWESGADSPRLDVPAMLKLKREIALNATNMISRIVPGWVPEPPHSFRYAARICTLIIGLSTQPAATRRHRRIATRGLAQSSGPRPSLMDEMEHNLTADIVRELVHKFMACSFEFNKSAIALAKDTGCKVQPTRAARELGLLQTGSLLTVEKAFFAAGEGEDILKHALIGPQIRAKKTKKAGGAMTREEVLDVWWNDAFMHPNARRKPPFVKLQ